jgi:hypothetical protein
VPVAHGKRLPRLDEAARPLGVFFNIHRDFPSAYPRQPKRHCKGIFNGFPPPALTFLNRGRSSPTLAPA